MQREELLPTEVLQLAEQSEEIVRKSTPAAVPLLVVTMCASMTFYIMFMIDSTEKWLQSFMGMAVLQLLPLVVLKLKIWTAPERLSLTPMLLEKTFLMHIFITLTGFMGTLKPQSSTWGFRTYFDPVMLLAGLAMLHKVFGFKPADLGKHTDVGGLLGFSFLLSFITALITGYWHVSVRGFVEIAEDAGNYADILAFVPVALLVCNESGVEDFTPGTFIPEAAKQRAYHFFAFIACFYLVEDLIEPYIMYDHLSYAKGYDLAMVAHVAHFVMLADFMGYFLCKLWFPSQGKVADLHVIKESKGLLEAEEDEDLVLAP